MSALILNSCSPEQQQADSDQAFFDLGDYFEQQYASLATLKEVQKTTSINGIEETRTIDSVDFKQELAVFVESDINRVSWIDKYQADTTFNSSNQIEKIEYKALDEKLRTKNLSITYKGGKIDNISIRNTSVNVITDAEQLLSYSPSRGYQISSRQKVMFSQEKQLGVKVKF